MVDFLDRDEFLVRKHDINRLAIHTFFDADSQLEGSKKTQMKRNALIFTEQQMAAESDRDLGAMAEMLSEISEGMQPTNFAYYEAITGINFWRGIVVCPEVSPAFRRFGIFRLMSHQALKRVIENPEFVKGSA